MNHLDKTVSNFIVSNPFAITVHIIGDFTWVNILQASTLVGPTRDNPYLNPLALLNLFNLLFNTSFLLSFRLNDVSWKIKFSKLKF